VTGGPLYSVDTSALIDGLERMYFESSFPGIWEYVADLIAEGRFFISHEVWEEAKKRDAVVKGWCAKDTTGKLIVPTTSAVTNEVKRILGANERMVMNMKGRNRADPFVIAVARLKGATVVTGEGSDGNESRPKIPYVCARMGIPCIRFADLIKGEGWVVRR
jgi:hypothetical protein